MKWPRRRRRPPRRADSLSDHHRELLTAAKRANSPDDARLALLAATRRRDEAARRWLPVRIAALSIVALLLLGGTGIAARAIFSAADFPSILPPDQRSPQAGTSSIVDRALPNLRRAEKATVGPVVRFTTGDRPRRRGVVISYLSRGRDICLIVATASRPGGELSATDVAGARWSCVPVPAARAALGHSLSRTIYWTSGGPPLLVGVTRPDVVRLKVSSPQGPLFTRLGRRWAPAGTPLRIWVASSAARLLDRVDPFARGTPIPTSRYRLIATLASGETLRGRLR